jgi:hypothetical protein
MVITHYALGNFCLSCHALALKNVSSTFQRAITYAFHDLTDVILSYLDDLSTLSKKWSQHLEDLRLVFQWCRKYNIWLNPLKFVFFIIVGHLSGFIFSQNGITMDPLKVQEINEIPPPENLRQLQSLQGKDNFLQCFILDYVIHTHNFLRLLWRDIPFHWDQHAQDTFDSLKETLSKGLLIIPLDFDKDYIMYMFSSEV